MSDFIAISRAGLRAATAFVPVEQRGMFALALLELGEAGDPLEITAATAEDLPNDHQSFPLTTEQARQLIQKIEAKTKNMLKEIVINPIDGVGTITWQTIKEITGVEYWSQFAQGRLGGLHRALRGINKVPGSILLWEGEGWIPDGKGDFTAGTMCIDSAAVRALQVVFGLYATAD